MVYVMEVSLSRQMSRREHEEDCECYDLERKVCVTGASKGRKRLTTTDSQDWRHILQQSKLVCFTLQKLRCKWCVQVMPTACISRNLLGRLGTNYSLHLETLRLSQRGPRRVIRLKFQCLEQWEAHLSD